MGNWKIERHAGPWRPDGVEVVYLNAYTGYRWPCGTLTSDIPDAMIVDWIVEYGAPAVGDAIVMSDGSRLRWTSRGLVAELVVLEGVEVDPRCCAAA